MNAIRVRVERGGYFLASTLFLASLLLGIFPTNVSAFAGGDGTQGNPYLIANCVQLEELDNNPADLSAYFALANDVDCSDTVNWNGGLGWVPMASFANRFEGTLDGNGHSITNLYLNREPSSAGLGLFSYTENATFKNFSISGSVSNPNNNLGTCIGALAGAAFDSVTIENVQSTVNLSGEQDSLGGFVGCLIDGASPSSITDSSVDSTIAGGAVGGLVANADISGEASLTIQDTSTAGTFSGSDVGGALRTFHYRTWDNTTLTPTFVVDGYNSTADITVTGNGAGIVDNLWLDYRAARISNSGYTGTLEATAGTGVAGLINEVDSTNNTSFTTITRSFVSSLITSTSNDVGGLVGRVDTGHVVYIEESYFGGVIEADGDRVGGLIANSDGVSFITNSFSDAQITGDQYVGGLVGTGQVEIDTSFAFGAITSSGTALGGLAGSLSNSTVVDSFAAVSVPANQPTTIGGLIGAISDVMMDNLYVDAGRTQQACYFTVVPEDTSVTDCTAVNETGDDSNYFFNNSTNPPLDQWDFTNTWQTNQHFYPCLQWQDNCQTFQPQVLCEEALASATTMTGRCDIQVRSGYDYGTTTWEARYKKVGDSDYTPIVLTDNTSASTTVTGLDVNTEYYLEFRFTNNWGTEEWARLEVITSDEPDVNISMSSAEGALPIDFSVYGCGSLGEWQTQKESELGVQDAAYSYPVGIVKFNLLSCPVGSEATINLTFTTNIDPSSLTVRKINENLKSITTLTESNSSLSMLRTTLEGKNAIRIQYKITDGGELDQDGVANGQIQDPVGIAQSAVGSPNTGIRGGLR